MILATIIIILLYAIIICSFIIGFDRVKKFELLNDKSVNYFSIIIPFRNEDQNLPELLNSLKQLNYPKDRFEFIFVDDDSIDDSIKVIRASLMNTSYNFAILKNHRKTNSPKKDALNTAIEQAKFDWIITTDADCEVSKNWLKAFDDYIQNKQPLMIAAPVTYKNATTFLDRFQLLDLLSLQGSTLGAFGIKKPFLCNGANLCYTKAVFKEVNGFEGNMTIASGDDIFLMEKIVKKHPTKVRYIKSLEALVTTKPEASLKDLIQQRIRWASKSTGYNNNFSRFVAIIVFLMSFLLVFFLVASIVGYFKWFHLLLLFGIKALVDITLLFKIATFLKQKRVLGSFVISSLIYPFFSMFVIIPSLSGGYEWKDRRFKK